MWRDMQGEFFKEAGVGKNNEDAPTIHGHVLCLPRTYVLNTEGSYNPNTHFSTPSRHFVLADL